MIYQVEIDVMPHKNLLDPQGKAVADGLERIELSNVKDVRIGKHISIAVEANDARDAHKMAELACKKLLVNPVMEFFEIEVSETN